jgi:glycosyltransferase involved in cell wall biosynthesis
VLNESHLLLSTAIGEPYGRNIVEAMSVGTPVIAHRSGGPAEIIAHDIDGWLVDESTPEAFAKAVAHFIEPHNWSRLSHAAHAKALQWRPEVVGEKLETLFRDLVARNRQIKNFHGLECRR